MSQPTELKGTSTSSSSSFQFDASAPSFVPRAQLERTISWANRVRSGPPPRQQAPKAAASVIGPPAQTAAASERAPRPETAAAVVKHQQVTTTTTTPAVQPPPRSETRPATRGPTKSLADMMKPPATLMNLDRLSAASVAAPKSPSAAAPPPRKDITTTTTARRAISSVASSSSSDSSAPAVAVADAPKGESTSGSAGEGGAAAAAAAVNHQPTKRAVYTIKEMLALRDLEECRVLRDKQDLPDWVLNVEVAGGSGIHTLLEYGRAAAGRQIPPDVKYQMPAALTRKASQQQQQQQQAGKDDWSRKAPLQRTKTADSQNNGARAAPLPEVPEGSWQVQQEKDKSDGDRGVKVMRHLRAQLNKMTPKTYEQIFKAILDIGIQNVSEAGGFVNLIFDKAITNHQYLDMYADLCGELELELQKRGVLCSTDEKDPAFKRLLIKQCQDTFRKYLASDFVPPENVDEEEAFEMLLLHKKKMKGNLMFVACLAQSQLIKPKILLVILNETLDTRKPLQLEALASFLPSCAPAVRDTKRGPAFFEYLGRCREVAQDPSIDQRVRYLLMDAIEQIDKSNSRRD